MVAQIAIRYISDISVSVNIYILDQVNIQLLKIASF